MTASLKEIKSAIREDFKNRRLTYQKAAELLNTSSGTVGNMLSNDKRISQSFAKRLSDALGYDPSFLMYGLGELYLPGKGSIITDKSIFDAYVLGGDLRTLANESIFYRKTRTLLQIMNNKVAIEALDALIRDDYESYEELVLILKREYMFGLPLNINDPKAVELYHDIRQNMTMLEVESAKELMAAEEDILDGKITEIEVAVNRFRKKAEQILKMKLERDKLKMEKKTTNDKEVK